MLCGLDRRSVAWVRSRGGSREDISELLGWHAPLQGEGEPFVVVRSLPRSKGSGRLVEVCKPMASPELLLVDPMATLHLPVLSHLHIAQSNHWSSPLRQFKAEEVNLRQILHTAVTRLTP